MTMLFINRLKARLAVAVPLLTLVGTFGLASAVHSRDDGRGGLIGFAQGVQEAVAALEPARVSALHVAVGVEVDPGQLIATLDTSTIDGEIAIAQAEKVRLEADVHAERSLLGRRLDVDRETLERAATKEREDIVRLDAESRALDSEIQRVTKLVMDHQAVATDLAPMNLRRAQLASLATEKPRTLGILNQQLGAATRRRHEIDDDRSAGAAKLDAELLVVQRRIDLLEKRRGSHLLRATHKGRVLALEKQPGETAAAGEAVVKLVSSTSRVIVCVPERRSLGLRDGDAARLWVRGQSGTPLLGRTVALGPVVSELPARCWPTPRLPIWGREITVAIETPIDVVAGEAFDVTLDGPAAPLPATSEKSVPVAKRESGQSRDAAPETTGLEPQLMTIPPSLARRTRFEPSGILAQPARGRYLVVSDDTGIKGGADDGRPWLFAMNGAGAVDPTPIAITGVSAIDDLESISAGDDGELYVLSSQSRNKKDRRKPARTALLRLRPDGAGFKVDGEVHLAELLDLAPERAAALGLTNGTRDLDVEGMTFHGGALYLGLKAPLDAHGDAMIWRITSPRALLDDSIRSWKRLEAAGLEPWGHVRVDVELDGAPAPGGISELLFEGETLFVASTPSSADGAAGALWRVESARGGALSRQLLRRFRDRKPEGLTPSLTRGKLMVVFDAGSETPSFLETPWPP